MPKFHFFDFMYSGMFRHEKVREMFDRKWNIKFISFKASCAKENVKLFENDNDFLSGPRKPPENIKHFKPAFIYGILNANVVLVQVNLHLFNDKGAGKRNVVQIIDSDHEINNWIVGANSIIYFIIAYNQT